MSKQHTVQGQAGTLYRLGRLLGAGGQGRVFLTQDGKHAVKILNLPSQEEKLRWRNQFNHIRTLPLRALNILAVQDVLAEPHTGYVMKALPEAKALLDLMSPPRGEDLTAWYVNSGSLRQRLEILLQTARVLMLLHSKGMVYGDPSPSNVLFTPDNEVHLIDADNLRYQSSGQDHHIMTPLYGAPELHLGRSGVNSLTDAFSFACMAFQCLTLVHPLLGDGVSAGPPELEEAALRGELPWVDHPEDRQNCCTSGLPRELTLSPALRELCEETFNAGLLDPLRRPGLAAWVDLLQHSIDHLVMCPDCGGTYHFTARECPWCNRLRPALVVAHVWVSSQEDSDFALAHQVPYTGSPAGSFVLSRGHAVVLTPQKIPGLSPEATGVKLSLQDKGVGISQDSPGKPLPPFELRHPEHNPTTLEKPRNLKTTPGKARWTLHHTNSPHDLHHFIEFEFLTEVTP